MPVGLSPATAPTIKSKSIAISTSYPNLSTLNGREYRESTSLPVSKPLVDVVDLFSQHVSVEKQNSVQRLVLPGSAHVQFATLPMPMLQQTLKN
jgi:hypothetical protein